MVHKGRLGADRPGVIPGSQRPGCLGEQVAKELVAFLWRQRENATCDTIYISPYRKSFIISAPPPGVCEAEEGAVMQATRFVSLGHTMYWWVVRFRAWFLLLGLAIVGAALGSAVGAD